MVSRLKTPLLLLGLCCSLLALETEAKAQYGRLFGTVIYASDRGRAPAASVRVIARGAYEWSEARTDLYGRFVMALRAGGYEITAYGAAGYYQSYRVVGYVYAGKDSVISPDPLELRMKGASTMSSLALSPTMAWGEQRSAMHAGSLALVPAQSPESASESFGSLGGTVQLGQSDSTKHKIRVIAKGHNETSEERADVSGKFLFPSLREGDYTICVIVQGQPGIKQQGVVTGTVVARKDSDVYPNPIWLTPDGAGGGPACEPKRPRKRERFTLSAEMSSN